MTPVFTSGFVAAISKGKSSGRIAKILLQHAPRKISSYAEQSWFWHTNQGSLLKKRPENVSIPKSVTEIIAVIY